MSQELAKEALKKVIVEIQIDEAANIIQRSLEAGINVQQIVDTIKEASQVIGEKFEQGEMFLTDLIMVGETLKIMINALAPAIEKERKKSLGTIVVGTVEGDLHDLGKNLFIIFAKSAGFEVIDLGVDVPTRKFIEAVKTHNADILGLSALLSTTTSNMHNVVEALKEAGLKNKVKVILGGAPVTEDLVREVGADAGVTDALLGVKICTQWMEGVVRI
jgi:methanogenic corrinoid protein MtbC1